MALKQIFGVSDEDDDDDGSDGVVLISKSFRLTGETVARKLYVKNAFFQEK